jgi:hypothetical protein
VIIAPKDWHNRWWLAAELHKEVLNAVDEMVAVQGTRNEAICRKSS